MGKLLRIDLKSCRNDVVTLILVIVTFAIGMFITLFLLNVSINGFVAVDKITKEREALELLSLGNEIIDDELADAKTQIWLSDKEVRIGEISLPVFILTGTYLRGNGILITPYLIEAMNIGEINKINFLGSETLLGKIDMPYPELFNCIFYIGNEISSDELIGEVAQFKSIDILYKYINNLSCGNNNYTKVNEIMSARRVFISLFAVFVLAAIIAFGSFFVTHNVKMRLINKKIEQSRNLRILLGYNNLQSKSCVILRHSIILIIGTFLGVLLVYATMLILHGISIPIFVMNFGDFMVLQWYTPFCYIVPYLVIIFADIVNKRKR